MAPQRTRDQARALFQASGLTYADLTLESLQALRTLINQEMQDSGCIQGTFRCRQRGTLKVSPSSTYAEIRCKADYFDDREAVSFNTDGFIGFAGWADATNVQPILAGFEVWVRQRAQVPDLAFACSASVMPVSTEANVGV